MWEARRPRSARAAAVSMLLRSSRMGGIALRRAAALLLAREACRLWVGEMFGLMGLGFLEGAGDRSLTRSRRRTAEGGAGPAGVDNCGDDMVSMGSCDGEDGGIANGDDGRRQKVFLAGLV